MAWQKGQSGNPAGRPKGAKGLRPVKAQEFAQSFLSDAEYQESVRRRIRSEKHEWRWLEEMVWAYAYGKPVERQEVTEDIAQTMSMNFVDYRTFFDEHANGHDQDTVSAP